MVIGASCAAILAKRPCTTLNRTTRHAEQGKKTCNNPPKESIYTSNSTNQFPSKRLKIVVTLSKNSVKMPPIRGAPAIITRKRSHMLIWNQRFCCFRVEFFFHFMPSTQGKYGTDRSKKKSCNSGRIDIPVLSLFRSLKLG